MNELKSQGKSFEISKREVWEAFQEVKRNKGAPGVDGQSIADFEADLKNNLYKIWNRCRRGRTSRRRCVRWRYPSSTAVVRES
jgi:RNA-directed DNA polymerase